MKSVVRTGKAWRMVLVLMVSAAALPFLGCQWGSSQPFILKPVLITEFGNDRKLMGVSEAVFFGKVTSDADYSKVYPYPTVTFDVEVLETLKGTASGTVKVNQPAQETDSGAPVHIQHAGEALVNGTAYVFIGNYDGVNGWYMVNTHWQHLAVTGSEGSSKEEILDSDHANQLRTRFDEAIENEIPLDLSEDDEEPDDSGEREER